MYVAQNSVRFGKFSQLPHNQEIFHIIIIIIIILTYSMEQGPS